MGYGFKREVSLQFEAALERVKESLAKEGFGVLTEADLKAALKTKVGADIEDYLVMGACSPQNAYKSILAEQDIGLLLPCNVIVYAKEGKTFVSMIRPSVAMGMIDNKALKEISLHIEDKLRRVMSSL